MAESESEEAFRIMAAEMLKSTSSIALPASEEHKSSYFVTKSSTEMVNEDPIRLQNQSCGICEEIVKIMHGEKLVYSSLARLPTFSIGLSSTQGEDPPRARLRESSVDSKDKSPHRYFQMPELGAKVFVGDGDGFDTIVCHLFDERYQASELDLDSEYAAVRSFYKDDRPGGLSGWLRAQPVKFWRGKDYSEVILSGTELFVVPPFWVATWVGNLGGKSSRVSGSSSDYKDCTGGKTIGQPSDTVEQPGDPVPGVRHYWADRWKSDEGRDSVWRSTKGSYLEKPKFMKRENRGSQFDLLKWGVLQLTRFDDFVILGNRNLGYYLHTQKVINIVRKNASETADVISTQLVKGAIEEASWPSLRYPIIAIVILLDHKEILRREHKKEWKENMAQKYKAMLLGLFGLKGISQSTILRDDKKIAKLKKEERITTLKEEKKIFASEMEDKKGIRMEEGHKVKMLGGELLLNVPQISMVSCEENELGMKSTTISSILTSAEVQDDSEALSVVSIEDDDRKSEDLMLSCHLTKWIIYRDLLERTLLCFFNMEEMQYDFYFEDHESMATIIGLGVAHSKVVLEYGSPHVTIVEIPKEDWVVVWALSNVIPCSILESNDWKQEIFPDILHRIATIINTNNIITKANNGGVGGDNGKDKAEGNVDDRKGKGKGKADEYDNHGNIGHPNGGFNGPPDDNDNKERKGKDGNDGRKKGCNKDDGKTCKEGQAVVHLHLLPGGVLKEKEKKGKGCKEVEKKKAKNFKGLLHAFTGVEKDKFVGNQQTSDGVENGDDDENFQKQLENQIHSQMMFTFTIKNEAGGPLKTIQATIDPITFQFPSNNKENYLQKGRFGWFHKELQVAFGVVNTKVAHLDAKSCKVLDSSEAKEVNSQGNSRGKAKTNINAFKAKAGFSYIGIASGEYDRTNGLEDKTIEEDQDSWETNKTLTKVGFSISNHIDLNSQQLKYSYFPHFPFNEKKFEVKDEGDRLKMYENPICQVQQVSCEGTWLPYKLFNSGRLEAYKLEASRELGMTRIYNSELETGEEKKQKGVSKMEKNLPLCFIQTLEKVVYLNHAMSHLTSSANEVYRLQEQQDPIDPSTTFLTQAQNEEEPIWPRNKCLVDVKQ